MFIVLEKTRDFPLLEKAMEQLKADFIQCVPNGVVTEDPDLSKVKDGKVVLVTLKEPYRLVDCMCASKENREFVYQVLDYLHQENHHLALSLIELRIMTRRLRVLTNCRISLHKTSFRLINLTDGRFRRGILGKDNLWQLITAPPETLPEINLEPDENIDNKVLVTIESKDKREDYMVTPEEPYTTKNGEIITITLPEEPDILA